MDTPRDELAKPDGRGGKERKAELTKGDGGRPAARLERLRLECQKDEATLRQILAKRRLKRRNGK